jgi:hypothetical protein
MQQVSSWSYTVRLIGLQAVMLLLQQTTNKLRGFIPQANYTD